METQPTRGKLGRKPRSIYVYSLGLAFNPGLRRVLRALGYRVRVGVPVQPDAEVAVWGRKPTSERGIKIARMCRRNLLTLEDGFLRSVLAGRAKGPPLGVIFDRTGLYVDGFGPSDLQTCIEASRVLSDEAIAQSQDGLERLRALRVSKYNQFDPAQNRDLPDRFVLVIDQVVEDTSVLYGGANHETFRIMLETARQHHGDLPVLIKRHPDAARGRKRGYFDDVTSATDMLLSSDNSNPWDLFDRAVAVYTVSSQLGMEAIFAGHRPHVFGGPFYAGRGLTHDHSPGQVARPPVSPAMLYHAAYRCYTRYFDPYFNVETDDIRTSFTLAAGARHAALGGASVFWDMRLWKRPFLRRYLSRGKARFLKDRDAALRVARNKGRAVFAWAGKIDATDRKAAGAAGVPLIAVEDGFLRSRGLGATLVTPVSLCIDRTGIYFDATRASDCEAMISASVDLPDILQDRALSVRERIVSAGLSKYNLDARSNLPDFPSGKEIILVPGQVEDDASIRLGCFGIRDNQALLRAVRRDFPNATLVYKPHPDVAAGLRDGKIADPDGCADIVTDVEDIAALFPHIDRVATMTSLSGFEAMLRDVPVTCYGVPFYAGWGLTDDRVETPERRNARPSLDQLVHAVLIDYPYYWDPVTQQPCAIETILDRFERGQFGRAGGAFNRVLSKAQGALISFGPFWR
ncbi:MAG: capsular polysaccharide biosynthesis protein [Pseudomonadota bacterium]